MAWQVSKRVWDFIKNDKKVKQSERLMLLALADIANEHGICLPKFDTSYQTLADMTGIERRSAIRVINNLIEAGHLLKSDTVGRGHSNVYVVIIGLSEAEREATLALISDRGVTNYKEEEGEMVTGESLASDRGVTNSELNGDPGVTHPILGNPSIPIKELPKGNGAAPHQPLIINPEPEEGIPKETLLPDTPELLFLFEKINHNRKLRSWGPVKQFKSLEQKQKCQGAAARLGLKRFKTGITKGLEKGLTDLTSLVNWLAKWELSDKGVKSERYRKGQNNQGQRNFEGDPSAISGGGRASEAGGISEERRAKLERLTYTGPPDN